MRRRVLAISVGLCAMAAVAVAQDGAVARVLGVKYSAPNTAEVEIQVVKGSFFNKATVDLFEPTSRMQGTITLPPNVEMLMAGDRVKVTVVAKGPFPLSGALIAEAGKFPNHAAALKVAGRTGPSPSPQPTAAQPAAAAAPPAPTSKVAACPYTAAELQKALGLDLEEGVARPAMPFRGGTLLGCVYSGKALSTPSLTLNQTVMDDPAQADPGSYFSRLAGRMQPVPNDPDKALWQGDQGDLTNAVLHYARKGVIVEARVSVRPSDAVFQAMRERLARLRRVPS